MFSRMREMVSWVGCRGRGAEWTAWVVWLAWLVCLTPSTAAPQSLPANDHGNPAGPRWVEGELLVKFQDGPRGASARRAREALKYQVKRRFDRVGWERIQLPAGQPVAEVLARYRRLPGVLAVEPNYRLRAVPMACESGVVPDDPRLIDQWGLGNIDATNAWAVTTGDSNVVVAVIDSGIRYNHEDLEANMWRNPGESGDGKESNGVDDDGNGYVDDLYGIDVVSGDADPIDGWFGPLPHGTISSGPIGAAGNNARGIAGVNWSVQLMALRFLSPSGDVTSDMFVEICDYVLEQKTRGVNVRVTNNSWGFGTNYPGEAVRDSIQSLGDAGILNVFAAGNERVDLDGPVEYFPQSWHLPSMINVAASDPGDQFAANDSNWGATRVDLAAPGVNILSTYGFTRSDYIERSGTSLACPHVAGAAALLAAAYPSAAAAQIKSALLLSVDAVPDLAQRVSSNGRLNVSAALDHSALWSNAPPHILASPRSQTVGLGSAASLCATATGARPLSFIWQFNGAPVSLPLEDSALTFESVGIGDDGDYSVVVSNAFGMVTSGVARLTVAVEPSILAQPQGGRVLDGASVRLSVTAVGEAPLSYQWRRDGQDIADATQAALAWDHVDWTLSGDYEVVLSNGQGAVTSAVARLTVLTRPYIVAHPQSRTVAAGSETSLSVTITNTATQPIGLSWSRNGLPGPWSVAAASTVVTNFLNIQTNLAGIWSVFVTNEAPSGVTLLRSGNAYLTVVLPPTNLTVTAGSEARFDTLAVGPAPIRYQWQRDGVNLAGATGTGLLLSNVTSADAAVYSVVVTNAGGEPAVFSATLDVREPSPLLTQAQRLMDGTFQMTLEELQNGRDYAVEISTNLTRWDLLEIFSATNAVEPFRDATLPQAAQRFYRVRVVP